tara:strand:+ start:1278 stop:1412 length:135 start_codon:yes stop_codon:yes gene_type:complete
MMTSIFIGDLCFYLTLVVYGIIVWFVSKKYSNEEMQLIDNKEEE